MGKLKTESGSEVIPTAQAGDDRFKNTPLTNLILLAKSASPETKELLQTLESLAAKDQQAISRATLETAAAKTRKSSTKRKRASPQTPPDSAELLEIDLFDYADSNSGTYSATVVSKRGGKLPYNTACQSCKDSHVLCEGGRPCKRCSRMKRADCCTDSVPKKRGRPTNEMRELREIVLQPPPKKRREKSTTPGTKDSGKLKRSRLVFNTPDPLEILVNTPSSISSSLSSFIDPQSPALAFLKTFCDNNATVHSTEKLLAPANHDDLTVCASQFKIYPVDLSALNYNFNLDPLAAPVEVAFAEIPPVDNNYKSCNNVEGNYTNIDEWLNSTNEYLTAVATAPEIPINEALSVNYNFFLNSDQTISTTCQNTLLHLQNLGLVDNSDVLSLFNSSVNSPNQNFESESWDAKILSLEHCGENNALKNPGEDDIDIMDIELTEEDLNILESLI
ncbi:hypothetical protein HK100_011348 [Physocladia obscura]|uniref:Zn(2)-C6 fungal-type domain-containing protein n=1 Tax=Physocladia obscura TaxID=109957 RepID=A0AAD5XID2_9FUNG|nr:hypothetical protein HK100_011348 [Physocladia obscura]